MRSTLLSCLATVALLAACGGSDDSTPNDAPGVQQERVVTLLMSGAGDAGIVLDEVCVEQNVAELSDEDARAIADAGLDGEVDVSDEADAIGDRVFSDCIDAASYAAAQVRALTEADDTIDADCLTQALDGLTTDEIDEQLFDEAIACSSRE